MKGAAYVYWTVHHLDSWIKRDQLDVTCFIISLFNAQHVSDVLTSETRWALNNEIKKQVTSSWSLFIQRKELRFCVERRAENITEVRLNTSVNLAYVYCYLTHSFPRPFSSLENNFSLINFLCFQRGSVTWEQFYYYLSYLLPSAFCTSQLIHSVCLPVHSFEIEIEIEFQ